MSQNQRSSGNSMSTAAEANFAKKTDDGYDQLPPSRLRLDVAIVGLPNSGKSQLLNVLTGTTVSAVSRKRHTTRRWDILAAKTILPDEQPSQKQEYKADEKAPKLPTQLLFLDTPGFLRNQGSSRVAHRRKNEGIDRDVLLLSAADAMQNVDYTLLVVDAAAKRTEAVQETLVQLMLAALRAGGRQEDSDRDENDHDDKEDGNNVDDENTAIHDVELAAESDDGSRNLEGNNIRTGERKFEPDKNKLYPESSFSFESDDLDLQKFAVVLNKVDLVYPKSNLVEAAMELGDIAEACIMHHLKEQNVKFLLDDANQSTLNEVVEAMMPTFFYTCALRNEGVDELVNYLVRYKATPCRTWELEPNVVTNLTVQDQVQEIIREKIYRCLHKEVPYQVQQQNRLLRIIKDPASGERNVVIHQDLIVSTRSHQVLVKGRGNQTLERIRQTAERDIAAMLKCPVLLHIHVKLVQSKSGRQWPI